MKNTRIFGGGQLVAHLSFIIVMTIYLVALTDGYLGVGGIRLAFAEGTTDINTKLFNVDSLAQIHTIKGSYYINSSKPTISSSSITNRTGRSGLLSSSNGVNLIPYKPDGWSDKIVVSNSKGTTTDSSVFYTTDTLYVDFAIANAGTVSVSTSVDIALYIDGVQYSSFVLTELDSYSYTDAKDEKIGFLTAGTHTIKIKVDSTGVVSETNESDNEYTKTITVKSTDNPNQPPSTQNKYNLLPYKPSDWTDKIVVSNTKETTTDTSVLYTTDTLYIDFAIENNGTASVSTTFYVALYIDGVEEANFSYTELGITDIGSYEDYPIEKKLTAGTHTIKIKVDSTGVVSETNESDNEYTKTIIVKSTGNPTLSVTPVSVNVSKDTNTKSFSVSNSGTGDMNWTASVTSGSSWLKITSGSSGTNSGTIKCSFDSNTTTSARTGKIRVTAIDATGSPKDVTVIQAAGGNKPTVTNGATKSVTTNTATLESTVNPNGLSTSYYFEYGKTTDYGSKTASADAGSDVINKSVSDKIDGLTENTAYHFRIVATNSAGTTLGCDNTFTTMSTDVVGLESPKGVTVIDKTSKPLEAPVYMGNVITGGSQMELSVDFPAYNQPVDIWILIALPDGRFYVVDDSNQLLNFDSSGFVPIIAGVSGKDTVETILESFEVGSAGTDFDPWPKEGTWSVYWLIAPADSSVDIIKAIGKGDYELGYYSFMAFSPIEDSVNPPSNLTAQGISQSQINISWLDNSSNETGFNIFRKTGQNGSYKKISAVGVNVSRYNDSGLSPNTTYYYKVTSFNTTSESDYSDEASTTTLPESTSDVGYAGVWNGTADFGTFTLTVNEDSTGITKFSRTFLSYKCGNATSNGSISTSSSSDKPIESIINNTFTLTSDDDPSPTRQVIFTLSGTFTSSTTASGTFTKTINGTTCSGGWTASK